MRRWTGRALAYAAVLMAVGEQAGLLDRFVSVRAALDAMWPSAKRVGRTYQGFIKALVRFSPRLLRVIEPHLRRCVRETAGGLWEVSGWVVMAVDGSRLDLPRTAGNERAFGCAGGGPQAWLTTVLHLTTGLCWCWKIGKSGADERGQLRGMMHLLPLNTLLVADAGYTGYELWKSLIDSGRSVLIRVGSNVRLLRGLEVRVGEGIVHLWPDKQRRKSQPPLVLRLIRLHDGRKEVFLITNVLDTHRLSDHQAAGFYRMRWGVELWFRTMKQTLARRKMRSDSPVCAALELRWSVVAMSVLGLLGVKTLIESGADPRTLSPAGVLRAMRQAMRSPWHRPRTGASLSALLRSAVRDLYVRRSSKTARDWPHKKTDHPPGAPKIHNASPMQIHAAQQLQQKLRAA